MSAQVEREKDAELLGRLLARWVGWVRRRPGTVLIGSALLTIGLGLYASTHLGVDTDTSGMFSADLPFRRHQEAFKAAFPQFTNTLLAVVDGPHAEGALKAAQKLAAAMSAEPEFFESVDFPGGDPFFQRNGLLFLSTQELEELAAQLKPMGPWVAFLRRDPGLGALATALRTAVSLGGAQLPAQFQTVLDGMDSAVRANLAGEEYSFPWTAAFLGDSGPTAMRRHVIVARPRLDFSLLIPGRPAIDRLRELVREQGLTEGSGYRVRLTGEVALAHEELQEARGGAIVAGLLSLVLVTLLLVRGLRSKRLVMSSLVVLGVGLVWTAGFATATVGHLNLISIAFAVLYISLGVAFAIHYCLHFAELCSQGTAWEQALEETARDVGSSLCVAALTTAAGFLAFAPTEFRGVAELGVIAGGGVLISLFASLTVLPALLATPLLRPGFAGPYPAPWTAKMRRRRPLAVPGAEAFGPLVRHAGAVKKGALVLGALALAGLGLVRFDPNPLHLRNPRSESVQAFEDLARDERTTPYRLNSIVRDAQAAERLKSQLASSPAVARTITLGDFVPRDQEAKLAVLSDLGRLFGGDTSPSIPGEIDAERAVTALEGLRATLAQFATQPSAIQASADRLATDLATLLERLAAQPESERQRPLETLQASLLGGLPEALGRLAEVTSTTGVSEADLPENLRQRWLTEDGRQRVEILPAEEMGEVSAMERFVAAVREVDPQVAGGPMVISETGDVAVRAFQQAFAYAFVAIAVLVLLLLRRPADVALLLALLLLSGALTAVSTVLLGIDFNFANLIALPLLLGMGVDSGIHMIHRWRTSPHTNILHTSTARAVLYSSLTTLAGFGTLMISPHPGTASVGLLLTIGIAITLICTMVVLTAFMQPRPASAPDGDTDGNTEGDGNSA